MEETGLTLYSLLEKASQDFSPTNFTDGELAHAKELITRINPLQLFDTDISFNIGQPTKLPDGNISFPILQCTTNSQERVFLFIKPNGTVYW